MKSEKIIKILQFIIYKCSDCPFVGRQDSAQIVNGSIQPISLYYCSKLKVKVIPTEVYSECQLTNIEMDLAEFEEVQENINIIKI